MKIMFCTSSLQRGGAERVVTNLCNELVGKHDISVAVSLYGDPSYQLNDKVHFFSLDQSNDNYKNFLEKNLKRITRLRKIFKEVKPDIVISFLTEPSYRVMIAKAFLNIKTIISVRNDPKTEYNSFISKILIKLLFTPADGFVFQTETAKQWFSKKIQKKSAVISNPLAKSFITKPYKGQREKTIINIGRLSEQKNQKLLIKAFSEVVKKHNDYILKIYGKGVLENQLKSLASQLNIENRVCFMGESSNIKEEIYKAGMFVLASNYEGMPNALMEAMALGIPCISTDCSGGGAKFLIENGANGLLINVNNQKEMTSAINYMIENPNEAVKMGNEANKICEVLNPDLINKKWEDYILSVCNKKIEIKERYIWK